MARVKLLVHTSYNGKIYTPGTEDEVAEIVALRWERNRIAKIISNGPIAEKEVKTPTVKIPTPEAKDKQTPPAATDADKKGNKNEEVSMDLTKTELIAIAVENGLEDVNDRMTKAEIIEAIKTKTVK